MATTPTVRAPAPDGAFAGGTTIVVACGVSIEVLSGAGLPALASEEDGVGDTVSPAPPHDVIAVARTRDITIRWIWQIAGLPTLVRKASILLAPGPSYQD